MKHRFEVKQVDKKKQRIIRLIAFLVILGLMFISFKLGEKALGIDSDDVKELKLRIVKLNERLSDAKSQSRELNEQKIQCERQSEFDRKDVVDAKTALADLQKKMFKAERELSFYQSLLDPDEDENSNKIAVHSFKVQKLAPQEGKNVFAYELVLNQFRDSSTSKKGTANIKVILKNGKNYSFDSAYQFKFYQRLKGKIVLKNGETIAQIVIKLQPEKGLGSTSKTYSWDSLIRGTK